MVFFKRIGDNNACFQKFEKICIWIRIRIKWWLEKVNSSAEVNSTPSLKVIKFVDLKCKGLWNKGISSYDFLWKNVSCVKCILYAVIACARVNSTVKVLIFLLWEDCTVSSDIICQGGKAPNGKPLTDNLTFSMKHPRQERITVLSYER